MRLPRDPRIVVVTRKTPLDHLLARHGTKGQAGFFLKSRRQSLGVFERVAAVQSEGVAQALASFPPDRRRTMVDRDDLDRFVFENDDVLVAVGQDGLVANVAKYLDGQPVIGVNPDPTRYDGVLCTVPADFAWAAVQHVMGIRPGPFSREERFLVEATRADGLSLRAVNELFIGHQTHQSAVYTLHADGKSERQSSSGIIVATGTGATGWARSIARQRGISELPSPTDDALVWFVREPFPSVSTACTLEFGRIGPGETLQIVSELGDQGTIFGDGIEADRMDFGSGQVATVGLSGRKLDLVRYSPGDAAER